MPLLTRARPHRVSELRLEAQTQLVSEFPFLTYGQVVQSVNSLVLRPLNYSVGQWK